MTIENKTTQVPTDILNLFGEPPVLQTEDVGQYNDMMDRFCELIKPNDLFLWWWVKGMTDDTWELRRLRRMKVLIIENRRDEWRGNKDFYANAMGVEAVIRPGEVLPNSEKGSATVFGYLAGDYKKLDILIGAAEQRRTRILRDIENYRKQLGRQARAASDKMIHEQAVELPQAA